MNARVRVLVENRPQQLFVQGILRDLLADDRVQVDMCWDPSGMTGVAEMTLVRHPGTAVALVVESGEDAESCHERLASIKRMLLRVSDTGWLVVVAKPRIDAWAERDDRIRREFQQAGLGTDQVDDRAALFRNLTAAGQPPFDRRQLAESDPEFAKLLAFVESHLAPAEITD